MNHQTTRTLFAYWNAVRANRPAPRRFDIEPSRISQILPHTLILERIDFETYRFRLAGTRICEDFGRELRGCDFLSIWPHERDRVAIETALSRVTRQCGAALMEFDAFDLDGRATRFELLLLPLVHSGQMIDRLLGTITQISEETASAQPPLIAPRLIRDEVIWPDTHPQSAPIADVAAAHPNVTPLTHAHGPRHAPAKPNCASHPPAIDIRAARIVRSERRQFRVYDGGRLGRDDG